MTPPLRASSIDDPASRLNAADLSVLSFLRAGDLNEAALLLDEYEYLVRKHPRPWDIWLSQCQAACIAMLRGPRSAALGVASEALASGVSR